MDIGQIIFTMAVALMPSKMSFWAYQLRLQSPSLRNLSAVRRLCYESYESVCTDRKSYTT